jgi:PAS domain S-box-containing protein
MKLPFLNRKFINLIFILAMLTKIVFLIITLRFNNTLAFLSAVEQSGPTLARNHETIRLLIKSINNFVYIGNIIFFTAILSALILINIYINLKNVENEEKEKRAAELVIANKELVILYEEKIKLDHGLRIADLLDIEKQKQNTELLIANQNLVFDNVEKEKISARLPGLVYEFLLRPDGSSCLPYASVAIQEIFRLTPEDVYNDASQLFAVIHPDDLPGFCESIQESALNLTPWKHEFRVKFEDGVVNWLLASSVPTKENDGSVLWHGFVSNINERKSIEEKLRDTEFRWKFAIEGARDGLWDWNVAENTFFYSQIWKEMLGHTEDEIGNGLEEWEKRLHPDDKTATNAAFQSYLEGKSSHYINRNRILCKDASYKWILCRGMIVTRSQDGSPLRMIGTHTDITDIVKTESFITAILNSTTNEIAVLDNNGIIIAVNDSWKNLAKDNNTELGSNYLEVCKMLTETSSKNNMNACEGIKAVNEGHISNFDLDYACHSPEEERWYNMSVTPLLQNLSGVVISHTNISDIIKRKKELVSINSELESFNYSVSHDLSSPLHSIIGFSQILNDHSTTFSPEAKDALKRVIKNANIMSMVINGLLELSNISNLELVKKRVNLSLLAQNIADELSNLEPARVINVNIQKNIYADGDSNILTIILNNLMRNAYKFTSKRPISNIEFGILKDGTIFLRDNGAGFDMRHIKKLFEAFERLHSTNEFQGTGIGLATVQRGIKRLQGKIWAEAEVDKGATFYFTLG